MQEEDSKNSEHELLLSDQTYAADYNNNNQLQKVISLLFEYMYNEGEQSDEG